MGFSTSLDDYQLTVRRTTGQRNGPFDTYLPVRDVFIFDVWNGAMVSNIEQLG